MYRAAFVLLLGAILSLTCDQSHSRANLLGSPFSGSSHTFTFSYPPPAHLTPINPGEDSFPLTNTFGTFAWTSHQVEDPGVTPHEQYGMWFLTLTPAGGGAAQQFTLPNSLGAMSMAQDNTGTVYIEQGDANWYVFLGWSLTLVGSPEPVFAAPGPLDIPGVSGPFTPSADGTTITAPTGTATSLAGVWSWGAADTGGDFFLLLNGARVGQPPFEASATTLTINAQGNAFYNQAHTGSNKVWLGYSNNASGVSTPGPIPVGVQFSPSYYSNSGSCVSASTTCSPGWSIAAHNTAGDNHAGTLISTITPTTSNGSTVGLTYQLLQSGTTPFQIVGNQLQLARALTSADEGIMTGGPLFAVANPIQNGVTMNNGWAYTNVDVLP